MFRGHTFTLLLMFSCVFIGVLNAAEDTTKASAVSPNQSKSKLTATDLPSADKATTNKSTGDGKLQELSKRFGKEIAEGILAHRVIIGMTMEQVLLAREPPVSKESIPPDAELWHYPNGSISFENGKVSYVDLSHPTPKIISAAPGGDHYKVPDNFSRTYSETSTSNIVAPTITAGDTYIYESIDPNQPKSRVITRRTVISSGDNIVVSSININSRNAKARNLYFNHEWNLIASRNSNNSGLNYYPPIKYFEFPLFPGKTWQQSTTETDIKTGKTRIHTINGTVGQWEDVVVPAGAFRAIRVNLNTELFNPSTGERATGTDTSWYVPEVHRSVKSIETGQDGKRIIQLIQYKLSGPSSSK